MSMRVTQEFSRIATPARGGGGAQAARVAIGMQVAAVGVVQRAGVALAGDDLPGFLTVHEAQRVVVVLRRQVIDFRAQGVVVTLLEPDDHVAADVVAIDGVPGDQLALQFHAFDRDVPHAARIARADGLLQRRHLAGVTEDGLAAAASRAAEAQVFGLEQRHLVAAFAQVQGGRQPGDATADEHRRPFALSPRSGANGADAGVLA